ncbi:hypothetical protein GCU69_18555, partial [Streptomyces lycii]
MLTGSEETAELYTALRAVLGDEARKWLDDGLTAAADVAEDEVPGRTEQQP